jgi:signal transduction histidine kinase
VDEGRIHQVLVNLVSNAIKYTPRGGRVRIEVRAQDGGALLAVEDTGMGFSPDQAAELFRPFSQPHGQRLGGFGLGLHISRLLTEMHGGTIQGASAGPGHGARFEVRLPCAAPTLAERATA